MRRSNYIFSTSAFPYIKAIAFAIFLMAMIIAIIFLRWPKNTTVPPLPKGVVTAPTIRMENYPSNILLSLRMSFTALQKILNKQVLKELPIQNRTVGPFWINGTMTRNDWEIKPDQSNEQRVRLDGTLNFTGLALYKPLSIFKIRSAETRLSDSSLAIAIGQNWHWNAVPDLKLRVTSINVKWIPDWVAKKISNFLLNYFKNNIYKSITPIAFRREVDSLWMKLNRDQNIPNTTHGTLVTRGTDLSINGPLIKQGGLEFSLNIDGHVYVLLDEKNREPYLAHRKSAPLAKTGDHFQKKTTLQVPFVINLQEAAKFFTPKELPIETLDGKLRIREITLSEKGGICYARGRVHLDVPKSQLLANAFSGETVLTVTFRPRCNPKTGEIYFENLKFTSASEAMLVKLLGSVGNTKPVLKAINPLSKMASSWLRVQLESDLDFRGKKLMVDLKRRLETAMPEIKTEISNAKPYIEDIRIKPVHLEVTGGFLLMVIKASGDIALKID